MGLVSFFLISLLALAGVQSASSQPCYSNNPALSVCTLDHDDDFCPQTVAAADCFQTICNTNGGPVGGTYTVSLICTHGANPAKLANVAPATTPGGSSFTGQVTASPGVLLEIQSSTVSPATTNAGNQTATATGASSASTISPAATTGNGTVAGTGKGPSVGAGTAVNSTNTAGAPALRVGGGSGLGLGLELGGLGALLLGILTWL